LPVLLADPGGRPRRTGLIDRRGAALAAPVALASLPVLRETTGQGEITGIR
jgi:hypothetical protein